MHYINDGQQEEIDSKTFFRNTSERYEYLLNLNV